MTPADRERLETAHLLLRSMRSREFRKDIAETTADGMHVIVPALPTDTMSYLLKRLRAAHGPIHVAIRGTSGNFLFTMEPYSAPRHARTRPGGDDDCPITPQTEVGMLLDYLRMHGTPCYLYAANPSVAVKLVDDDLTDGLVNTLT